MLGLRVRPSNEPPLPLFLTSQNLLNLSEYPPDIPSRIHQSSHIPSRDQGCRPSWACSSLPDNLSSQEPHP
jgi:hypothetical protein